MPVQKLALAVGDTVVVRASGGSEVPGIVDGTSSIGARRFRVRWASGSTGRVRWFNQFGIELRERGDSLRNYDPHHTIIGG